MVWLKFYNHGITNQALSTKDAFIKDSRNSTAKKITLLKISKLSSSPKSTLEKQISSSM